MITPKIGFIGQGWIGKNYADDFERRGFTVVRYALEEPYAGNRAAIAECDIVFVAVPTPTTPEGFDASIIASVLSLIGKGKTAVIKSTIIPGTTEALQKQFPDIIVLHSPEFLRETTAAKDASAPERNIIGIPEGIERYQKAAAEVLEVLPRAPYARVMAAKEAELVKYAGNSFLMMKVVYANMLYDLATALGVDYDTVKDALGADPRIGVSHLSPVAASGHSDRPGRGAGGHCFIKDFEAFRQVYAEVDGDPEGAAVLAALARKNTQLLVDSGKDSEMVRAVYGSEHPNIT